MTVYDSFACVDACGKVESIKNGFDKEVDVYIKILCISLKHSVVFVRELLFKK